ncbi:MULTISPECIES: ATP-binding protein [unclassified Mesorhizobium]|uniref:ATP-binding protein n=1 Tax=unclassified Mesorhizobium TaxID=325217 RepID=UPI0023DFAB5D|nr:MULTISPECIES: ATP-binding protein [unclassified Mesorhizobium]MDF3156471.1 ATP-binding protein [Mesorhizobium sp. XAP10]MDF3249344.1 ATP-binding protein [Mesorhizobium sp. XAP4]
MAAAWRELAEQSSANELSRDEWLGLMLDREVAMRAEKRLRNRLASAKLRFPEACIEDIDFAASRGLTGATPWRSPQGEWLKAHENLIVTGQTGPGKSWLACLRPASGTARSFRALCARAAPVREPCARPRRWPLRAPHRQSSTTLGLTASPTSSASTWISMSSLERQ